MSAEIEKHPTNIVWSGMTHPGKVRANNEDAFLALTFDAQGDMRDGKEQVRRLQAELAGVLK